MSMLLLLVLVTGVVMSGLLAAWTIWFQGYIYSQPVEQIFWRAPAAGGAVMLFLLIWVLLDYAYPGSFSLITEYSANHSTEPVETLKGVYQGQEATYTKKPIGGGKIEYRDSANQKVPSPLERITIVENEEEVVFEPDRDAKGKFKIETGSYLVYRDKKGRTMSSYAIGTVTTTRTAGFILNLVFNLLFVVVWFLVLWLILDFQWAHAFVQAWVVSVVMFFLVMGPLLLKAEKLGQEAAKAKAART